jgi:hypothetical protein
VTTAYTPHSKWYKTLQNTTKRGSRLLCFFNCSFSFFICTNSNPCIGWHCRQITPRKSLWKSTDLDDLPIKVDRSPWGMSLPRRVRLWLRFATRILSTPSFVLGDPLQLFSPTHPGGWWARAGLVGWWSGDAPRHALVLYIPNAFPADGWGR